MIPTLVLIAVACQLSAEPIDIQFVRVSAARAEARPFGQSSGRRAVVLLEGLRLHPFSQMHAHRAELDGWQKPESVLVRTLSQEADVFALAYSQNVALEDIAECPEIARDIRGLREQGYGEVVLVGHSAGGVIARMFVEDHPEAGVAKVIQVCAPNAGTSWAKVHSVFWTGQAPFLESLTKDRRDVSLRQRVGKCIPDGVQFACIVGTGDLWGDGVVWSDRQWPADLQWQGIPAVPVFANHVLIMRTNPGISKIAELVRSPIPRWSDEEIGRMRQKLLLRGDLGMMHASLR